MRLFLIACLIIIFMSGAANADEEFLSYKTQDDYFAYEAEPFTIPNKLQAYDPRMCREIIEILKHPENKNYVEKFLKSVEKSLFFIPEGYSYIEPAVWEKSSAEEFKDKMPEEYEYLLFVFENSPDKNYSFRNIRKLKADLFSIGVEGYIYEIQYGDSGEISRYMDTNASNYGLAKYFHDNLNNVPFFKYRGMWARVRSFSETELNIYILARTRGFFYPEILTCKIKVTPNVKEDK